MSATNCEIKDIMLLKTKFPHKITLVANVRPQTKQGSGN